MFSRWRERLFFLTSESLISIDTEGRRLSDHACLEVGEHDDNDGDDDDGNNLISIDTEGRRLGDHACLEVDCDDTYDDDCDNQCDDEGSLVTTLVLRLVKIVMVKILSSYHWYMLKESMVLMLIY